MLIPRWRCATVGLALLGAPGTALPQRAREAEAPLAPALSAVTPQLLEAQLRFLSDDLMEGRAPGTRGGDLAARYVAAQFAALGLRPGAPDGSFYQWVSLVGLTPEVSIVIGAQRRTLVLDAGSDIVAWPERADSVATLDAEVVFGGYGIAASEWGWDDYKGAGQTGRIVMVLPGEPDADSTVFRGKALTGYGLWTYKVEQAARMGAIGVLLVHARETAPLAWNAVRNTWSGEHLLADRPPQHSLRFAAWITEDAARRVVEATGKDYALLLRRAAQRDFRPVEIGARAAVDMRSRVRRLRSPNVIARLEGADSLGRTEAVVVTAHYDHLGTGRPDGSDSIYNGAVDNASGVSVLLTTAAALTRAARPPRRTVVFVAPTAAEAGSLGAATLVAQPPIPLDRTVAVMNLDVAGVWGPSSDLAAIGAELSSLSDWASAAARPESLSVSRDPNPERGDLYRGDHLAFARAGIPVALLRPGMPVGEKAVRWGGEQWYHRPSDQVRPDFDYRGLVQVTRVLTRMLWSLADTAEFPSWRLGAEFRPAGQRLRPAR